VLRDGRIEGFDSHDRLLEQSPFYREALRLSTVQHDGAEGVLDLDAATTPSGPVLPVAVRTGTGD
jgi:hypothetical protein